MRFRSYFKKLLTLLAIALLLYPLLPLQKVSANHEPGHHGTVNGERINVAKIRVTYFTLNADSWNNLVEQDIKDRVDSHVEFNAMLQDQVRGEYVAADMFNGNMDDPDFDNDGFLAPEFTYAQPGCGGEQTNRIQYDDSEGRWKFTKLYLKFDGVDQCIGVQRRDFRINLYISNDSINNRDKLFEWVNERTVVRLDGKDGNYVKSTDEPDKFYNVQQGGSDPDYIQLQEVDGKTRGILVSGGENKVSGEIINVANRAKPGTREDLEDAPDGEGAVVGDCDDILPSGWKALNPFSWNNGSPLDWFGCVVIRGMLDVTEKLSNAIDSHLVTDFGAGEKDVKAAWSSLLIIANILFVIAFLLMVLSTALNLGVVDAYTVKKLLPRLFLAAVLANLSFVIVTTMVDITNTIGQEIHGIILAPVGETRYIQEVNKAVSGAQGGVGGAVAVGAGFAVSALVTGGIFILGPVAMGLLFAIAIAWSVVMIRRIIILLLAITAPIAFALWVIPGTQDWAKKWWKLFSQMLLAYPFIMAIIASGKFTASIIGISEPVNAADDGRGNFGNAIAMLAAIILPYVLLPTVFKLASGTLGTITGGMMNNKAKGLFDRVSNKARERSQTTGRSLAKKDKKEFGAQGRRMDRWGDITKKRRGGRLLFAGTREKIAQRGVDNADVAVQRAKVQQYGVRGQEAEEASMKIRRAAHQLDASKLLVEIKDKSLRNGRSTVQAQDDALDEIVKRARQAAKDGDTEKFSALMGYLSSQKAHGQLNTLQTEAATTDNPELTYAWTKAVSDPNTYGDLKGLSPHLVADVHGRMDPHDLATAQVESIEGASLTERAMMPKSAWKIYEDYHGRAAADSLEREILDNDAASSVYKNTLQAHRRTPPPPPPPPPSDIRLKRNISSVGVIHGSKVYSFKYIWSDQEYVGVMAQDVMKYNPEAVIKRPSGYYYVDYSKLGFNMMTLEEWNSLDKK